MKNSPEIKSYQFETLFSRTFFLAPVWFYTKKSSEKSPLTSENALFKIFFSSDLFSSGLLFLRSYFLRLYWQPPYYFMKKFPVIQNTGLYFQWPFFQGLEKDFFLSFYFQVFFQKLFSRDFLTQILF